MKILATITMPFMKNQMEVVKAFLFYISNLATYNDVTLLVCQPMKNKILEKSGLKEKLEEKGIKIVYLKDFIIKEKEQMFKMDNNKMLNDLETDYNLIISFTIYMMSAKHYKDVFNKFYNNEPVRITFNSNLSKYKNVYPIYLLNKKYNIPVLHYMLDWNEPRGNEIFDKCKIFSYYSNKDKNAKVLPLYEMYVFKKHFKEKPVYKKEYDFVFGYTVYFDNRKHYHQIFKKINESDKVKLFAKDRFWPRNDTIKQSKYFEEVSKSKFTLIIPATVIEEFSLQRFYESISVDCIPIIYSKCNMKNAFEDMQDVIKFYKENNLIVDIESIDLNEYIKNLDYNKLIKGINNLESIKALKSVETYKNHCKNFKEFVKK